MENSTSPPTTSNKILVVLVNWNGKLDTLECLTSLKSVAYPHTAVVVDNGSRDDSVACIRKEFPEVLVFETGGNLGFAGGNNVALEWALKKDFEWILLLNNDTVVDPNFLSAFLDASRAEPKAKILGAKIYRYDKKNTIDHLGGMWNPNIGEFVSLKKDTEHMQKVDYVCGAALFMHRSVPEDIGLLEPSFFLFWEETDFCCRARRRGFEVWTAPKAKIWHKVSSSFTGGKPQMHYFWWRSRLLWISRNLTHEEKKRIYRNVILPDLWKTCRHYLLRSLQNGIATLLFKKPSKQKALRNKAGLVGAIHYFRGRFGTSPRSLQG